MYQLKKGVENFQVMSSEFEGRKFVRGTVYKEIPPGESHKFEEVKKVRREEGEKVEKKEGKNIRR